MSSSSVNVQVAGIRAAFDASDLALQWVVAAFLLGFAALLPLAGQLVDRHDPRRVFRGGVLLFGVASLLCAAAPLVEVVILGRLLQGVGAALSAPAALALVTEGLPEGAERNRAVATYGAMGAVGFSAGLVLPGALVTATGWRASFLVVLPVVAVVLGATWALPRRERRGPRTDGLHTLMLVAFLALGLHLLGRPEAAVDQPGLAVVMVVLAVALAVSGHGRRRRLPAQVWPPVMALGAVFAGVLSGTYVLSLGLQDGVGRSALATGLLVVPQPLTFALTAGWGARATGRFGAGCTLGAGVVVLVASLVGLGAVTLDDEALVLVAMVGVGLGMALTFPAASIAAVDRSPVSARGRAAGTLALGQNVGGAAGVAVLTVLGAVPAMDGGADSAGPGLQAAGLLLLGGAVVAAALALVLRGARGVDRAVRADRAMRTPQECRTASREPARARHDRSGDQPCRRVAQ